MQYLVDFIFMVLTDLYLICVWDEEKTCKLQLSGSIAVQTKEVTNCSDTIPFTSSGSL